MGTNGNPPALIILQEVIFMEEGACGEDMEPERKGMAMGSKDSGVYQNYDLWDVLDLQRVGLGIHRWETVNEGNVALHISAPGRGREVPLNFST